VEHVIASYLRKIWDKKNWLFDGQHGFMPGYSCVCQVITVHQDITDSLDNGSRIDTIIIDFSKAFDLVPHDRLLKSGLKISHMDKEILLGRTQRVKEGGQLSKEVRALSGVPQGSVRGPLLFLAYINGTWRNILSTIRLCADDCIIYIQKLKVLVIKKSCRQI
jgi:hypothetical protein